MKSIEEILVFIEDKCLPCERVIKTVERLHTVCLVNKVRIFNRNTDPQSCHKFGVRIFPTVFINGRLAFYGEFSVEDVQRFIHHSVQESLKTVEIKNSK